MSMAKKCQHGKRADSCFSCKPKSAIGYIVRARMNGLNQRIPYLKELQPVEKLGISYAEYLKYLENRYEDEYGEKLDWNLFHSEFSVEHITPISWGEYDELDTLDLLHYTNTCVMRKDLNLARSNYGQDYDTWLLAYRFGMISI